MFTAKDKNMARASETRRCKFNRRNNYFRDITSSGDIRVTGPKGSINTKGKVVVGSTGIVEGDVVCQNADISGELKAKISVSELLALKSTAKLDGDIVTNKLAIEPGATFSGSCSMGAVIKDIKDAGKQEVQNKKIT